MTGREGHLYGSEHSRYLAGASQPVIVLLVAGGGANVWTHMSADEERGLVYLPVSAPSPNFWGGNRTQEVLLGTSTTALDIETGEVD
ncbi:hypothetical protein [Halomonas urumqiensis]|uniref:Pyrrolo-quinoline quinone repeat domain-containing protein n=1 Tax=Halomonas urumqiensis TaxID=1684789 RepID=A0A2N7UMU4_9GAMM|nr:hypothetical protein [Halomonas urumqiensis]PMR81746.1 hypothetical protein C1H70_04985 [Halomonas urumqiensis]PTB02383.1 hypothetical protein C6V82_11965 [Halomonas urumqiensis]GHE21866.1 hypothetical protein GCM10017767_23870 [Halomonas urumqiensis]